MAYEEDTEDVLKTVTVMSLLLDRCKFSDLLCILNGSVMRSAY